MLKIGELAKICNVAVQTLRYYDSIGVLKADYVDQVSGYRYYAPEKIQIFQIVSSLKKLNFSLEEIKDFLKSSQNERLLMYEKKKRELEGNIKVNREIIKLIDDACSASEKKPVSLEQQINRVPFEDDPCVVGKWELCGELPRGVVFSGMDSLQPSEKILKTLFFLPGGGHVWTYFWTKGLLYICLSEKNTLVPNDYRIFSWQGETYLSLNWMVHKCLDVNAKDCILIYRQIDSNAYTEKQTFLFRDDMDRPYVSDARVLGKWETVGILSNPSDLSQLKGTIAKTHFYITGMEFLERGKCFKWSKRGNRAPFDYTAGYILNNQLEFAEAYVIRRLDQEEYLIVEHKSMDYAYLGKVFCYYVFKRK